MPETPRHIIAELKKIDERLDAKWDKKIHRYMVYHKDKKEKVYPVMKIQYPDGSYKPLDQRTVRAMKYSNHLRHKRPQDILYSIDKQNEEQERDNLKRFRSDGEAISKYAIRGHSVNVGGVSSQPHKVWNT